MITDTWLTTRQAAAILPIPFALSTLHRSRVGGWGPAYIMVGRRARYRHADLETWLNRLYVPSSLVAQEER